ncbi:MAG: glycosyltransferase family 9 protein [Phycisphaerales bacterium]
MKDDPATLVFHRAALGDFALIWPRLRELAPCGVVSDLAKARLAARFIDGVAAESIERPRWNDFWREDMLVDASPRVSRVVCYIADDDSVWARNARRTFPNAKIDYRATKPPDRLEEAAWQPERRPNTTGPIVFHVGAGSNAKRWPLERSIALASSLDDPVIMIAGEVERERFTDHERESFIEIGGQFLDDLDALAGTLSEARTVIGFDSGPTHLAAQLGLRTVALFGPTEPGVWAPIGPEVEVIAPPAPTDDMSWLELDPVLDRLTGR